MSHFSRPLIHISALADPHLHPLLVANCSFSVLLWAYFVFLIFCTARTIKEIELHADLLLSEESEVICRQTWYPRNAMMLNQNSPNIIISCSNWNPSLSFSPATVCWWIGKCSDRLDSDIDTDSRHLFVSINDLLRQPNKSNSTRQITIARCGDETRWKISYGKRKSVVEIEQKKFCLTGLRHWMSNYSC